MKELENYYEEYKETPLFRKGELDIPDRTKRALDRWACEATPPGGFLTAVLKNDLEKAVFKADLENQRALVDIVKYVKWRLPANCKGDEKTVEAWAEEGIGLIIE